LPLDDPLAARLRAVAGTNADDPAALVRAALAVEEVFGPDLRRDAALENELTTALARIVRGGARAALPS
jgi:mannitol-1-phosphate/altronate dehydrogenase